MTGSIRRRLLFLATAMVIATAATEIVLQVVWWLSPTAQFQLALPGTVTMVPDDRLGWRGHPGHPEHDRNGFRNRTVPETAKVIAMGDSQTYGYHVRPHEAWPRQLEPLIGQPSYVMAYGGYGPVHSLLLSEEAIRLKPRVLIEAMYSGNDLYESFTLVYYQNQTPWLKSRDGEIKNAIEQAERIQTVRDLISGVYWMGTTPTAWQPAGSALRQFVSRHCRIYGLLRAVKYATNRALTNGTPEPHLDRDWPSLRQYAGQHKDYCVAFEYGPFKTIMNPSCRAHAVNMNDPRIAEGHRIAMRANRMMARRADEAGIQYLVMLIPTKELVFRDVVRQSGLTMPAAYHQAVEREQAMWHATKRYLDSHGIDHVDTLDALRKCLADGTQPFHMSLDTHLNPDGHRAVAKLVQARLAQGTPPNGRLAEPAGRMVDALGAGH